MKRLLTITVVVIAALCTWLAIPSFVSTDRLRTALEQRLTMVFGHEVALKGGDSLTIRPYLETTYEKVRLGNADGEMTLVNIEEMRVQFNAVSLVSGRPSIKKIVLVRPKVSLRAAANDGQNWLGAVDLAKFMQDRANETAPPNIEIVDGIVDWQTDGTAKIDNATSLNGALTWNSNRLGAAARLSGIWNGEAFNAEAGISELMAVFKQGNSQANIVFNSKPLRVQYEGDLSIDPNFSLKGQVDARTSSAFRASQWLHRPLPALSLTKELRLVGSVESKSSRFNVQEAVATIGDAVGRGRLQFIAEKSTLSVEGTLAFDEIRLPELFELGGLQEVREQGVESISDGLEMDVRMSANTATSGPLVMEALAASVFIKDGKTLLDIGQAQALDGQVAGTFRPDTSQFRGFAADLTMTDIDLLQLSQLYGTGDVAIEGRGDARFKLQSTAPKGESLLRRLNGSARIEGQNGVLRGVNLEAVSAFIGEPEKIEASSVFSEQTGYDAIDLNFFMANGVAFFQDTTLTKGDVLVSLAGRSDLDARSLALQGRVLRSRERSENSDVVPAVSLPFMVGGTAGRPLFIALPSNQTNTGPPNAIPESTDSN